jgi:hypothetical protein
MVRRFRAYYDYVQYDACGNGCIRKGQTELGPDVKACDAPIFSTSTALLATWSAASHGDSNSGGWTTWDESRRVIWGHSGDGGSNAFIGFFRTAKINCNIERGAITFEQTARIANHNAMQIDHRATLCS